MARFHRIWGFISGLGAGLLMAGLILLIFQPGGNTTALLNADDKNFYQENDELNISLFKKDDLIRLERNVSIRVEPGDSALKVARKLETAGLVKGRIFLQLASLTGWDRSIRPGLYHFKEGQSDIDVFLTICNKK